MKGNWIVKNLLCALALVIVLIIGIQFLLGGYTRHGRMVTVPDFTNMQPVDAAAIAQPMDLHLFITDSVFVPRMDRGAVFSQNPKPGAQVKQGRKIRLTINAVTPKQVTVPNLVGLSMRQAKSELASRGLYLGRLMYVSDIATNNVLKQMYHGSEIAAGTSVISGSSIDLMVGLNDSDFRTMVPDVKGMRYLRAVDVLKDYYLNVGSLKFDKTVKTYSDSLDAVVYSQTPAPSELPLRMGESVSISLSLDPEKASTK